MSHSKNPHEIPALPALARDNGNQPSFEDIFLKALQSRKENDAKTTTTLHSHHSHINLVVEGLNANTADIATVKTTVTDNGNRIALMEGYTSTTDENAKKITEHGKALEKLKSTTDENVKEITGHGKVLTDLNSTTEEHEKEITEHGKALEKVKSTTEEHEKKITKNGNDLKELTERMYGGTTDNGDKIQGDVALLNGGLNGLEDLMKNDWKQSAKKFKELEENNMKIDAENETLQLRVTALENIQRL